jgi:hypothetical protein
VFKSLEQHLCRVEISMFAETATHALEDGLSLPALGIDVPARVAGLRAVRGRDLDDGAAERRCLVLELLDETVPACAEDTPREAALVARCIEETCHVEPVDRDGGRIPDSLVGLDSPAYKRLSVFPHDPGCPRVDCSLAGDDASQLWWTCGACLARDGAAP